MRGSTGQLDKRRQTVWHISKRGNSYSVRYTYEDEHGKSCDKWESFPTKEEATNRKKQIEHELAAGTFLIPSSVTVAEFLMDRLPKQCSKHKWAPKTYESNPSTIQNLIIPYIGSMEMQKLKPYHMENLYTTLSKTPCGSYIESKKQNLTEKQKQRFLSGTTIHEVHRLLGTAFQYAVGWGIFVKSPVPVDCPKKSTQERTIWTVEEMRAALDSMDDPILHLAVHLTLVGALREGEIVGLTPEDLDFDAADGIGTFRCHLSQLMISGGDIKAVQGTTGHASADMLVNTYAHIQQSSRVELGKKFESGFYAKPESPSPQAVPAAGEPTISMTALLELLKDADPEMKAKLRLALLT